MAIINLEILNGNIRLNHEPLPEQPSLDDAIKLASILLQSVVRQCLKNREKEVGIEFKMQIDDKVILPVDRSKQFYDEMSVKNLQIFKGIIQYFRPGEKSHPIFHWITGISFVNCYGIKYSDERLTKDHGNAQCVQEVAEVIQSLNGLKEVRFDDSFFDIRNLDTLRSACVKATKKFEEGRVFKVVFSTDNIDMIMGNPYDEFDSELLFLEGVIYDKYLNPKGIESRNSRLDVSFAAPKRPFDYFSERGKQVILYFDSRTDSVSRLYCAFQRPKPTLSLALRLLNCAPLALHYSDTNDSEEMKETIRALDRQKPFTLSISPQLIADSKPSQDITKDESYPWNPGQLLKNFKLLISELSIDSQGATSLASAIYKLRFHLDADELNVVNDKCKADKKFNKKLSSCMINLIAACSNVKEIDFDQLPITLNKRISENLVKVVSHSISLNFIKLNLASRNHFKSKSIPILLDGFSNINWVCSADFIDLKLQFSYRHEERNFIFETLPGYGDNSKEIYSSLNYRMNRECKHLIVAALLYSIKNAKNHIDNSHIFNFLGTISTTSDYDDISAIRKIIQDYFPEFFHKTGMSLVGNDVSKSHQPNLLANSFESWLGGGNDASKETNRTTLQNNTIFSPGMGV